jgi:NAD(P)H-hydrate epimerase
MKQLTKEAVQSIYVPRQPQSNKGSHGHAYLVAGNSLRMGAAIIAAKACMRAGVGLLTLNIPFEERCIIQIALPEAMLVSCIDHKAMPNSFQAFGIGPAIGISDSESKMLGNFLNNINHPVVIDADAITLLSNHPAYWESINEGSILTPHVKEFDRLFGTHDSVEARINTAIVQAKNRRIIIVLKDQHTIITDGESTYYNNFGNSGLAKGGSGDALTGIILSFMAQGYPSLHASLMGVFSHGNAADITLKSQSVESMLITDVIENIGSAFKLIS